MRLTPVLVLLALALPARSQEAASAGLPGTHRLGGGFLDFGADDPLGPEQGEPVFSKHHAAAFAEWEQETESRLARTGLPAAPARTLELWQNLLERRGGDFDRFCRRSPGACESLCRGTVDCARFDPRRILPQFVGAKAPPPPHFAELPGLARKGIDAETGAAFELNLLARVEASTSAPAAASSVFALLRTATAGPPAALADFVQLGRSDKSRLVTSAHISEGASLWQSRTALTFERIPGRWDQQISQDLPKGVTLALPVDERVISEWSWLAGGVRLSSFDRFSIDREGRLWYGARGRELYDPRRDLHLEPLRTAQDLIWLDQDQPVMATRAGLGFVDGEAERARFHLTLLLPSRSVRMYRGSDGTLFVVRQDARSGKNTVLALYGLGGLSGLGESRIDAIKVIETDREIASVSGDAQTTYIASGPLIVRARRAAAAVELVFHHPDQDVKSLAYAPGAGLFYATDKAVGLLAPESAKEFVSAPGCRIQARGESLFIMLGKSREVLRVTGLPVVFTK